MTTKSTKSIPSSLKEYAHQVYEEINPGEDFTADLIGAPIAESKASSVKEYGTFTVTVPIEFTGTLESFDKQGTPTWIPKTHSKVGNHIVNDIYTGSDGNQYRRILVRAEIAHYRNGLPFSVGVKFNGIPNTSTVYGVDKDVDYPMLPESAGSPDERLHLNDWNEEGMKRLAEAGWSTFTEKDITDSVLEKGKIGWKLKDGSPILDFGVQRGQLNKENTLVIPSNRTKEKVYCVEAPIAQKLHNELINEYNGLPFHNPNGMSATLHRLDGEKWASGKVGGIGNSYNHPGLNPKTTVENVGVLLRLTYQNWGVRKNETN
jgi:hypothetical protein